MGVKAVVKNFNYRGIAGDDEGLHKVTPILRDLVQGKPSVVEHIGASLQFRRVPRIDIEQRQFFGLSDGLIQSVKGALNNNLPKCY